MTERASGGTSSRTLKSLLIVKPSSLGDILHALPLVEELHSAFPGITVDWVANGEFVPLIRRHPGLRNVWEFPRKEFGRPAFFGKMGILSRNLSAHPYEVVLDAQGLLRSAILSRMAARGAGSQVLGFASAREGATLLYDRTVKIPESPGHPFHAVPRNLLFLEALGAGKGGAPGPLPLQYGPEDRETVDRLLAECGLLPGEPFIALHPGARRESKRWPSTYFSDLLRSMGEKGLPRPILLGDRGESSLLSQIESRSGVPVSVLAGGIPLDLLPHFLSRAILFVGNDSGPLHMAALSGVPTLSFYGSSDPGRTGPWGNPQRNIVLREPVACSPCGDFRKSCAHMTCQVTLTPSLALDSVLLLLERARERGIGSVPLPTLSGSGPR